MDGIRPEPIQEGEETNQFLEVRICKRERKRQDQRSQNLARAAMMGVGAVCMVLLMGSAMRSGHAKATSLNMAGG